MKTTKFLMLFVLTAFFASCDTEDPIVLEPVASETVSNLHAPQGGGQGQPVSGPFTKFDFETGAITTSETDWDIAFRGTSIIVNGGVSLGTTDEPNRTRSAAVYIANGGLASVSEVDTSLLTQDTTTGYAVPSGSGNGWYSYAGPPSHLITPIAGRVLVIKTTEGRYAKVEITSYYENAPVNPDAFVDAGRYFTFNYVYQPNQGLITFE